MTIEVDMVLLIEGSTDVNIIEHDMIHLTAGSCSFLDRCDVAHFTPWFHAKSLYENLRKSNGVLRRDYSS